MGGNRLVLDGAIVGSVYVNNSAYNAPNFQDSSGILFGISGTTNVQGQIASGASATNLTLVTPKNAAFTNLTLSGGTASTLLTLDASKVTVSLANGAGWLTNDGAGGFGFSTNITQNVTINNLTTTNLNVVNLLTISNIITTNITVLQTLTTSNFFTINGKNNTLIVTNTLQVSGSYVYPLLAGTGITLTTNTVAAGQTNITIAASAGGTTVSVNATNVSTPNIQDTATVTWAVSGSNLTATAAGGGSATVNGTNLSALNLKDSGDVTWSITSATNAVPGFAAQTWNTLAYSGGTNVVIDCSLGNSLVAYYKLSVTNPVWFSTPTSIPTTPKTFQVWVQQASTGTVACAFTNVSFKWPGGVSATADTNNSAVTVFQFATEPFTNSVLAGFPPLPQVQ
jgi:hypothetical protein